MNEFSYHNIFETKGIEYILTIIFFVLLIPYWLVLRYREKMKVKQKRELGVLSEDSLLIPQGLYYGKNHTWAHINKAGTAMVGIDDFLARVTGEVEVRYKKSPGQPVKKGEPVLEMISGEKSFEISSPISGTLTKTNNATVENPAVLQTDPYKNGWAMELKPDNWLEETQQLYFANNANDWMKKELTRFKDFLAASYIESSDPEKVALQDGGALREQILTEMPEKVWKDFEKSFLAI